MRVRRAFAAVLAAVAAAATMLVAFAEPPSVVREAARPAPITLDIFHVVWTECTRDRQLELGTSTSVHFVVEDEGHLDIEINGSPADEPLEATLQSCVDRFDYSDAGPMHMSALPPLQRLLAAAYQDSVLRSCFAEHGRRLPDIGPWQITPDGIESMFSPFFDMNGDAAEIAELRRDCPPYPAFLVPDTPVR